MKTLKIIYILVVIVSLLTIIGQLETVNTDVPLCYGLSILILTCIVGAVYCNELTKR